MKTQHAYIEFSEYSDKQLKVETWRKLQEFHALYAEAQRRGFKLDLQKWEREILGINEEMLTGEVQ